MIAEIDEFKNYPNKPYEIDLGTHGAPKKQKTVKWIKLRDAKKVVWKIKMNEVSDRQVTEEEFKLFKKSH
jgi:hypothetical protein